MAAIMLKTMNLYKYENVFLFYFFFTFLNFKGSHRKGHWPLRRVNLNIQLEIYLGNERTLLMFCFQFGKNYGIVLRFYNSRPLQLLGKYASAHLTKDKSRYKKLVFEKIINSLKQRFSTWGTRTPRGTRKGYRGYAKF
jgi:hypothetical protein